MTLQPRTPEQGEQTPEASERVFEKRWWMWVLAVATMVVTADLRSRLGREWDSFVLVEGGVAAGAVALTCSLWRGKIVSGFLAIGAAMCVLKAVQVVLAG